MFYYRALKTSEMDSSGCVDITRYPVFHVTPPEREERAKSVGVSILELHSFKPPPPAIETDSIIQKDIPTTVVPRLLHRSGYIELEPPLLLASLKQGGVLIYRPNPLKIFGPAGQLSSAPLKQGGF